MLYQQVTESVHLVLQPLERKKVEIEIVLHAGGSLFEQDKDRGKKHLMEHCIASRTKEYDFQALKDLQFRENINLNAYTGPLTMGLTASGHRSDFRKMFALLWEMATHPTFDQSILEREKEIVLREISERRGDPTYQLHYYVQNQLFTPDSYDTHEVLGSSECVAATTLEDLYRLHQQSLQNSHLLILASGGGLEEDWLLEQIQAEKNSKQTETA